MTGSPTSVAPGLAPTALSWGYPHLDVFALAKNRTDSIYWKWRSLNATSDDDFQPPGRAMAAVGGGAAIDTAKTPSIALAGHIFLNGSGRKANRTEIQFSSSRGRGAFRTYHDEDQRLRPSFPDHILQEVEGDLEWLSAPTMVRYAQEHSMATTFVLGNGVGPAVWYMHMSDGGPWTSPKLIAGPRLHSWATPAVVAWAGDDWRLDLFVVSKDNHLQHAFTEGGIDQWGEFEDLGGFVTTPPTAVSRAPECLDVFTRGGDGGLWHLSLDGGGNRTWSAWKRISGGTKIRGQPDAVSSKYNSIDVLAWSEADGALLHKTYDSVTRTWTPSDDGFTTLVPGGLVGPPKGVVAGNDVVYVFAYNGQNEIVWQTIGPDKKPVGEAKIWAQVPYDVS